MKIENRLVNEIVEKYQPLRALDHATAVMEWDMHTYMPPKGAAERGEARSHIELLKREKLMGMKELVEKAADARDLNYHEASIVRLMERSLAYYTRNPPELLEEFEKVKAEASGAWVKARAKSEYAIFSPYLARIIDLTKQFCENMGYKGHPYNAVLDMYEEGITVNDLDPIFADLIPGTKKIMGDISNSRFTDRSPLEDASYNIEEMKKITDEITALMQIPSDRFRVDLSVHPFTIELGFDDVRITTRYPAKNFKSSMYSTIHESGHAIYNLQLDESMANTPAGRPISLGIHESQSRFWENFIGRNRSFVDLIYPALKQNLSCTEGYSADSIYYYFNDVKSSPIRVEADEITYNMHIALRYELEKKIISNDVGIDEIPAVWNELTERYLGISPKNDAEGVLQDVHWSMGSIGYFPSYTLGNIVAAMIYSAIDKEMDIEKLIEGKQIAMIKDWLKEHIHRYGSLYTPKDLLKKEFGTAYNVEVFNRYLERKYT